MRQALMTTVLLVPVLNAQDVGTLPAFEVASIQRASPGQRPSANFGPVPPDRFIRRTIGVQELIVYAYEVRDWQIVGLPAWTKRERFAVEAKAPSRPTLAQMRLMMRSLLAERFSLKTHFETRELPRYALVMARDDGRLGEKLRRSAFDCPAIIAARGADYRAPTGPPQPGDPPRCSLVTVSRPGVSQTMFIDGYPLSRLVETLQESLGRVIIDKTGLTGTYDLELQFEPPSNTPAYPLQPDAAPSIFTALQEQLGLKLESERGPVEVLVIDSVERPTPD